MKASDREKEFEFQRYILVRFRRNEVQRAMQSLSNTKKYMDLALRILFRACSHHVVNCLLCSWEELGLCAKHLVGLKLKRGRIVSCFPESCVPSCFPPEFNSFVERPGSLGRKGGDMKSKKAIKAQVQPVVRRFGYAVISLKGHICINGEAMPAIFTHRRKAVSYRNELIPHIGRGKVIRIEIIVSIV